MKPIQVVLPKNPWGESLRHPLSFSSYPSRLCLPINVLNTVLWNEASDTYELRHAMNTHRIS